jgi:predicted  nucleic acid-binding Zn-ribbon protein
MDEKLNERLVNASLTIVDAKAEIERLGNEVKTLRRERDKAEEEVGGLKEARSWDLAATETLRRKNKTLRDVVEWLKNTLANESERVRELGHELRKVRNARGDVLWYYEARQREIERNHELEKENSRLRPELDNARKDSEKLKADHVRLRESHDQIATDHRSVSDQLNKALEENIQLKKHMTGSFWYGQAQIHLKERDMLKIKLDEAYKKCAGFEADLMRAQMGITHTHDAYCARCGQKVENDE